MAQKENKLAGLAAGVAVRRRGAEFRHPLHHVALAAHPGGARCMTHELWSTLNEKMVEYLDSVSLQDLVDQQKEPKAAEHRAADSQSVVVMHRPQAAA